jgi:hypothetical protein
MEFTMSEMALSVVPVLPVHLKTSPQATPLVVQRVSPMPVAMVAPLAVPIVENERLPFEPLMELLGKSVAVPTAVRLVVMAAWEGRSRATRPTETNQARRGADAARRGFATSASKHREHGE